MYSFSSTYIVANLIDGEALAALPDDFTELSHMVPQTGWRIKLKAAIGKLKKSNFDQFFEKVRHCFTRYNVPLFVFHNKLTSQKYLKISYITHFTCRNPHLVEMILHVGKQRNLFHLARQQCTILIHQIKIGLGMILVCRLLHRRA